MRRGSRWLWVIVAILGSGCMSAGQNTLDEVQQAVGGSKTEPHVFTEAYIEFPGPAARWAGPATLLLHVSAKDPGSPAEVSVTPETFEAVGRPRVIEGGRAPASASEASHQGDEKPIRSSSLTAIEARDQLAHLATALQGEESPYVGCLYPVRVRLIRADGALLDRQGCRGQTPWARSASQAVDFFLAKSRNPSRNQ